MTLYDFEGIADGATLTAANTGANAMSIAAGGSATASTADAVVGSAAGKFVGDASNGSVIVTWPNAATVAVCFAFKFITGSGGPWGFAYVDGGATSAYKLNYASGTLYSGAWNSGLKMSLAAGDVVWISVVLDGTAGTATGHVYDDSLNPIATINDTLDATGTFATTNIGAGVGQTTAIDCLTVNPGSTTEIAPGQPSPPVTTGPVIRGVIQGGVEVGASLRGVIQSGTEVTATVKEVVGDTSPSGGGGGDDPAPANLDVGWIGDSLTTQDPDGNTNDGPGEANIKAALVDTGWSTSSRVDGLAGRKIRDGSPNPATPTVISNWRADGFDPSTWVFALGNNSYADGTAKWTSDINANLDDIAGGNGTYTVYLFGMTSPDYSTYNDQYLATLKDIAAANTRTNMTVHVLDLDGAIHTGADESAWWQTSGIHMTATGYAWRNRLMVNMVGGAPRDHDWSDANPPWAYTSNQDWEQHLPDGATIVNIQTGSTDFRTNLQNTINAAGGRCIVRLDDGVYHLKSFDMIGSSGDPLYAMGYWHPNLQGLIGNGPDKTIIQMDADSLTQDQLDAMGNLTAGATGSPLQTGFMRFDGTDLFIGGLTFRADDQQDLTAIDSTVAAYGVQVPQPAPHQGVIFYPGCYGTVSHVRFQAAGRGCMNLPPFEMGNWNSQQTNIIFRNVESDGRKAADLDPRRPRRSGLGMMNNEYMTSLMDCWLHHSNLGKFAYNDQNRDTSGVYLLTRCKFNNVSELPNTDPDYGNLGANPNGNRPVGWESCAATIIFRDCYVEQDRTITAPQYQISLTTITRNPTGGRLTITGSTFTFPDAGTWAYLAEYTALRVVSSNTHWYSDGLANTLHIESPDGNLLTAWTTSSWPPSQSTLNAASVTPSTHYLVFTG